MSVNIWVTEIIETGQENKASVSTGSGLTLTVSEIDGSTIIFCGSGAQIYGVRETPAEVMALVAAEQRKRDRLMLAGQFMAAAIGGEYVNAQQEGFSAARDLAKDAVYRADALLAALDAREGVDAAPQ